MTQPKTDAADFSQLGIAPNLLKALAPKFTQPTPIQYQVIPIALEGKDVVGIAQTGTGKTLAFGIPMLQLLAKNQGQGLVLLPTRELAQQVEETLSEIGKKFGLRTAILIGGASMSAQIQSLKRNPHIIVATPGRLFDQIEQKNCRLDRVKIVVLDEADRMLDIGFLPQIKKILKTVPENRQTLLFSATMPTAIAQIASAHMKMPLRIEVAPSGTSAAQINQHVIFTMKETKMQLLDKMLAEHDGSILVFSRTKYGAKKIAHNVRGMGHASAEIHSNLSPNQRKDALAGFKSGKYRVLVATDIAARGLDVNDIALVINYDLPDNNEDYVHRIGRTGRAGKAGKAISFAAPSEWPDIRDIEKLIRKKINVLQTPELPPRRIQTFIKTEKPIGPMGRTKRYSSYSDENNSKPRRHSRKPNNRYNQNSRPFRRGR